MMPGSVVLVYMPQAGGVPSKLRPALVLADLPGPYQDLLVCGISSQLTELVSDWDEIIRQNDPDFSASGLRQPSAIRPSFLAAVGSSAVAGTIGEIDDARLERVRARIAARLTS